jgi:hypothetical protein
MHAFATKIGNSLCHALSIGGCEYSHTINGLGYAAIVIPLLALAMLFSHRSHH